MSWIDKQLQLKRDQMAQEIEKLKQQLAKQEEELEQIRAEQSIIRYQGKDVCHCSSMFTINLARLVPPGEHEEGCIFRCISHGHDIRRHGDDAWCGRCMKEIAPPLNPKECLP